MIDRARRVVRRIEPPTPQSLAAFHALVGLAILAGGGARFGGPSFANARVLAPWWAWGLTLLGVGTATLAVWPWLVHRHRRTAVLAIAVGAVPLTFLTVGFILTAHANPIAATSGIGAYGAVAVGHLHLAGHMIRRGWLDRP